MRTATRSVLTGKTSSRGDDVRRWWYVSPGVEKRESLSLALAGATGVSGGSAHTVPILLPPNEISGRSLSELTELKPLVVAKLGQVDCFRIEGKFGDQPLTLWIDRQTFLVRRISMCL